MVPCGVKLKSSGPPEVLETRGDRAEKLEREFRADSPTDFRQGRRRKGTKPWR
jgi:hypothetical protein